jgi:hypothetical protein
MHSQCIFQLRAFAISQTSLLRNAGGVAKGECFCSRSVVQITVLPVAGGWLVLIAA